MLSDFDETPVAFLTKSPPPPSPPPRANKFHEEQAERARQDEITRRDMIAQHIHDAEVLRRKKELEKKREQALRAVQGTATEDGPQTATMTDLLQFVPKCSYAECRMGCQVAKNPANQGVNLQECNFLCGNMLHHICMVACDESLMGTSIDEIPGAPKTICLPCLRVRRAGAAGAAGATSVMPC